MTASADTHKRGAALKQLREQHQDRIKLTQALLKEQQAIRRLICQSLRDGARTVPEIALESGLPADQVLWHITAMKKYGLIVESGICGEYYLYRFPEEAKP